MAKLTAKQEMFVQEYLIDLNATQAAIRDELYKTQLAFDANTQFLLIVATLNVLLDNSIIDYFRKKAALLILKYYIPDWWRLLECEWAPISRHDKRVDTWKNEVLSRDNGKCNLCGSGENIEVHHIIPWADYPQGRIDVNNGVTLCNTCHAEQHIDERQLILHRAGKRCCS